MSLNPKKCRFMVPQGKLLGHIVCKEGLKKDPDKARIIVKKESLEDVTGVKSFHGHVGYYRRFIMGFYCVLHTLLVVDRVPLPFLGLSVSALLSFAQSLSRPF